MLIRDLLKGLSINSKTIKILDYYSCESFKIINNNLIKIIKPAVGCIEYKYIVINTKGEIHNENGVALKCHYDDCNHFYINDSSLSYFEFAEKTKHIICNSCGDFCRQECFL